MVGDMVHLGSDDEQFHAFSSSIGKMGIIWLPKIRFFFTPIKRQEREKGVQKGKIEGKIEMLRELGFTIAEICQKLSLATPEVEKYFKGV